MCMLAGFFSAKADKTPKKTWNFNKPMEQRVFIENNGQYFIEGKLKESEILYGSREADQHYFFTKKGFTILSYKRVKRTEKEIEAVLEHFKIKENKKVKGSDEPEFAYKNIPEFHEMEWLGANPNPQVIAEEKVTEMYNYPDARHPKAVITIQAHAYKKITYKNVYPNIDVEYIFPEGKEGFKYSLILHPGADASLIQMKYPENENLSIDAQKNLNVKSPFGTFIDHAPTAFNTSTKNLACSFTFKKNIAGFVLPSNNITQETTIDPWVQNPLNVSWNSGYDVDYDNAGNVYINGGRYPYQIKKYSAGGTLQWSFSCAAFIPYSGSDGFYGDFAVDKKSGSVYATEGYDGGGAMVIKISALGAQLAVFAGNVNFNEMWRISFSKCTNQAVIAGGGTSSPSFQACFLDTNLTALSMVTVNGGSHDDVSLLALDNYGSAYMLSSNSGGGISGQLVKCPLPGLLPVSWQVPAGYSIAELSSFMNIPSGSGLTPYAAGNGFSGLTTANTKVYSYDGYVLKQWNGATGAMINSTVVNVPSGGNSTIFRWSGLTADDCDHIFLGSANKVLQYDVNLNLVSTIAMTDTVYDVQLGANGNLYTTGKAFVSSTSTAIPPCTLLQVADSITNATCANPIGSATITVSNGIPAYTITWNTNPVQTGSVVTNLAPGTYIATITDMSCPPNTTTDTIIINNSGGASVVPTIVNVSCNGGNNGSISLAVTGTVVPTYTWSTGSNAANITNLIAGTYSVIVSAGNGCNSTLTYTVTQPPIITATLTPGIIKCFGDTTSINITVAGGTPTYTVAWNTAPIQIGNAHGLGAGTYTVGVVDTKGCTATFTATLTQPAAVVATFTTNSSCFGSPMQFTDISPGGPFTNWSWTFGDGGTSIIQNPPHTYTATGNYAVNFTVTTAAGCSATVSQTITIAPALTVVYHADTVCLGQVTTFADLTAGVPGGSIYAWTFGDATNSAQPTTLIHAYQGPGTYTSTLSITTGAGCVSSATLSVLVKPIPVVTAVPDVAYCPNVNTTPINFVSTPAGSTFNWTNSNAAIGLPASGTGNIASFASVNAGNVTISGAILVHATLNGCVGPDEPFVITVNPNPTAAFSSNSKICQGSPMSFTDLSSIGSGFINQWNWDLDGDGNYNNSTSASPQNTFATGGSHTVGLTVISNKLCRDTVTKTVYVNYKPVPAFVGDNLSGCPVLNVNFTDNSSIPAGQITGWSWNFGNGTTAGVQFPQTISYNNPSAITIANFNVTLTLTSDSGCVATLSKPNYIVVYPTPIADFSFASTDGEINVLDPTVHFYDMSIGANSINWNLGDIFNPNQASNYTTNPNPVHTYFTENPYIFYVTQVVSNNWGCKDSITKPVEIKPTVTFYIPNAFSPNGDILNEGFKGTGIGIDNTTYSLLIFDRWGNLIFTANDIDKAWDGRLKKDGDVVQEDVYVWKVSFRDTKGLKHQYSGTVSLLK